MSRIKCEPKGEMAVREWIAASLDDLGFYIIESGSEFPDLVLENESGERIRTEVEYKSSSFISHKHNPKGCDLVMCWKHNSVLNVPVLELSTLTRYDSGESPQHDEIKARFNDKEPTKAEIFAALSSIPHLVNQFLEIMADDLKTKSEFSRKMTETRLPLLRLTNDIIRHLESSGLAIEKLNPDDLLTILSKMHTI